MTLLAALYLLLCNPPSHAEISALRTTAPEYLTSDANAEAHLVAARAAGAVYGVRPELLLAIAWHESRYVPTTRTPESGGRESCGVMTPTPVARCQPEWLTVLGGYAHGAAHLAIWSAFYRGRALLLAYAGGGGLARACAHGSWLTPRGTDACAVAEEFAYRDAVIKRGLTRTE